MSEHRPASPLANAAHAVLSGRLPFVNGTTVSRDGWYLVSLDDLRWLWDALHAERPEMAEWVERPGESWPKRDVLG